MQFTSYASQYKDQPAVTIETEQVTAQFLPHIGAKLCSLVYRPAGRELLVQRPGAAYRVAPYDGDYVGQGECSGLDDMFPTIDRCYYAGYPWQGTPVPDHGEVWSLPWSHRVEDDGRLYFGVHGVRFPYRLEKWASFGGEASLRLDYRLTNLAPFDLDCLWAAHPMFNLEEGAELILPQGVERAVTIFCYSGSLGGYGHEFTWPCTTDREGQPRDLRRMRPKAARDAYKYFVKDPMPEGWCALTYPASNFTLALGFPLAQVPYLGILPNEGGWQDLYNIFLEPATAPYDRPDVARLHGRCSSIKAGATCEWYLVLALAPGLGCRGVNDAGMILR